VFEPATTGHQRRAFLDALGDVVLHSVALALHRQRPHLRGGVEWVADLYRGERGGQRIRELIVPFARHHDPGQRGAHLAGQEAFRARQCHCRGVHIRVGQIAL
jgi:hypothetical protein